MGTGVQQSVSRREAAEHRNIAGNLVRGALIGTVETIPGVSGGTVALVVGIYDELITSASHVVSAAKRAVLGPDRAAGIGHHLGLVNWRMVLPVLLGMALAVFTAAGPIAAAVEEHPELMRALFFGMVLVSTAVPLRLAGKRWKPWDFLLGAAGFLVAFLVVSLPPTEVAAHPVVIVVAAAVAVSALLLPGLSGSFILLTIGLYQPTLRAVAERDLGYLTLFALGALLGLVVIVKGLQWLLARHHRPTMIALAGLMLGALRALWPWQGADRTLHAPGADWPLLLLVALAGGLVVAVLIAVDVRLATRRERERAARIEP